MADSKTERFYSPRHWTLAQRLAHYTAPPDANGCRLWTGSHDQRGYGSLRIGGRPHKGGRLFKVYRLAWELAHGPIPPGTCVLHKCDVPACLNPDHLFLGTQLENIADMVSKGRSSRGDRHAQTYRGEKNGFAKLTSAQVLEIRADPRLLRVIAAQHGITFSNVSMIKKRRTWRHL